MKAFFHLLFVCCGMLGLFLGGFLIDLDHGGTVKDKWREFWHPSAYNNMGRGIFHNPVFAFSLLSFLLCFCLGYICHLLMDFIVWYPKT